MKNNGFLYILSVLSALMLFSCSDERFAAPDFTVSGEESKIRVNVSVPGLDVKTRASLGDDQINEVSSLWIRTYSSYSGKATSEWVKSVKNTYDTEVARSFDIDTKSGYSYVVGVANIDNLGVTKANPDEERPLSELLEDADTWEKFLDIAVVAPSSFNDVNAAPVPLAMSGCLCNITVGDMPAHPEPSQWGGENYNFKPVFIPATSGKAYVMPGAIHLRRLVSHITFNIKSGPDVTVTPTSYTVYNVPAATWLYERSGQNSNFGHDCTEENKDKFYATPSQYTSQYITEENGVYKFDFWQGENKHSAIPDERLQALGITFSDNDSRYNYDVREREKKKADGTNSGLYLTLTGDSWTPANMASFVAFHADLVYNEKQTIVIDGKPTEVTRVGNAMFTVHLGFLNDDPRDFNCYRNVDYTYNVTINGVNNIVVEAEGAEQIPGMEGMVSDLENPTVFLDAHYACYNIYLSKEELQNTMAGHAVSWEHGMGFVMSTWDYGVEHSFTEEDFKHDDNWNPIIPADKKQYVDWVELRPTTGEKVLASYHPKDDTEEGRKTFTLPDAAYARHWADSDPRISESGWYTVFVNDYVYENSSDESKTPAWKRYVNENPRQYFIRVTKSVSTDKESVYARSKYAGTQSSIQSYYTSEENPDLQTALGVEHINESYGLNLRNEYRRSLDDNGISGRYFLAYRLAGNRIWQDDGPSPWTDFDNKYSWNNFIDFTTNQNVNKIDNQNVYRDERTEYLYTIKDLLTTVGRGPDSYDNYSVTYEADRTENPKYIEAILACLNRNRDNDGDGMIDASELRWFIPTRNQYIRVILGRGSLTHPLVDVNVDHELADRFNRVNSKLLFYTPEGSQVWAMEGTTSSPWRAWNGQWASPWEVRCVRNLGTDLGSIAKREQNAQPAYYRREGTNIIDLSRYDNASIRSRAFTSSDNPIPVHHIYNQDYNRCYKAFEFLPGSEDVKREDMADQDQLIINNKIQWAQYLSTHNPCKHLVAKTGKDGWRVPNQKELTILSSLGIYSDHKQDLNYYYSCSMSYYDQNGVGFSDTNNSFDYDSRYVMKIMTSDGTGTQGNEDDKGFGVRCVRDVIE